MKRGKKKLNGAKTHKVVRLVATTKKTEKEIAELSGVSKTTVQRIKKSRQDQIQAKKDNYIKIIDNLSGGDTKQAQILADMVSAKNDVYNFQGELIASRPDYKMRLEAIKYIDGLKDRHTPAVKQQTQNNFIIGKELDRYTS